jgi:cystinosin
MAPTNSDGSNARHSCCRDTLFLLASPVLDETGSVKSVVAGMMTLFVVGSLIGVASSKNHSLPTPWYQYASAMIGYVYFICWSISFYPQVISNYKRKTTQGLSADFCTLNVLGFACYTVYNTTMFWSPEIRELYRSKYGSYPTVQSNDVAFAIHALVLSSITLGQILYYRGSQYPSKIILVVIALILLFCVGYPVLVFYTVHSWLDYIYALSFVKIGISLIKYIPQMILNFRRKSTVGWSIWNILLDFTGGILSDTQLVLDCVDMNDFSGITGNLAKFGLGFVSIFFDIIFLVQHYILFPDDRQEGRGSGSPELEPLLSDSERQGENSQELV